MVKYFSKGTETREELSTGGVGRANLKRKGGHILVRGANVG